MSVNILIIANIWFDAHAESTEDFRIFQHTLD